MRCRPSTLMLPTRKPASCAGAGARFSSWPYATVACTNIATDKNAARRITDSPLHSQKMTFCNVLVIRTPTFETKLSVGLSLLARESRADLTRDVVEQGDAHHEDQECDPDLLAEHLRALGERTPLQPLH